MDPSTYNGYYRARRKKVILNRVSSFDKAGDGDPTDVLVLMELAFSGTVPRKIAGQGEVPGSLYQFARTSANSAADIAPLRLACLFRQSRLLT
jgi:hypothetical protein